MKVKNIPYEGMFGVPGGYFDHLTDRVMETVKSHAGNSEEYIINPAKPFIKRALLIAASVAGFVIISYTGYKIIQRDQSKSLISRKVAYELVESLAQDFEENLLIDNIPATQSENKTETDEMIGYLVDEGIDELTLMEAL